MGLLVVNRQIHVQLVLLWDTWHLWVYQAWVSGSLIWLGILGGRAVRFCKVLLQLYLILVLDRLVILALVRYELIYLLQFMVQVHRCIFDSKVWLPIVLAKQVDCSRTRRIVARFTCSSLRGCRLLTFVAHEIYRRSTQTGPGKERVLSPFLFVLVVRHDYAECHVFRLTALLIFKWLKAEFVGAMTRPCVQANPVTVVLWDGKILVRRAHCILKLYFHLRHRHLSALV